jgi:hypothetical protein
MWNPIRAGLGLLLPVFAEPADFARKPRSLWWTVHLILVAAVAGGLYLVNQSPAVEERLPFRSGFLQDYYLPLAFLVVWGVSWLGYWLYRSPGDGASTKSFPDIDAAWAEVIAALSAESIGIADAPIYLILGRAAAGEEALIQAAEQPVVVRAPAGPDAPLRVYANRDAIFVTCAGASAWGRYCALLAGEEGSDASVVKVSVPAGDKTIQFGTESTGMQPEQLDELRELLAKQQQRDLTAAERSRLQELAELTKGTAKAKQKVSLTADAQARGTDRLRHLCSLIRRDRRPWCPINGVLLLVPWAATESDESTKEAVGILNRDLSTARESLHLHYPTFALVCDLETARGFAEFRESFTPETLKKGRIGQRLPLVPDMPPGEVPGLLERGIEWIGQSVLPAGILRFLRLETPAGDEAAATAAGGHNRNLYMLLSQVYQRGPRLGRLLSRGLPAGTGQGRDVLDALPLLGGCYLAGTGRSPEQQAFAAAVIQRLMAGQSNVSWTAPALAEDDRSRRVALIGSMAVAAVAVAATVLAILYGRSSHGA